MRAEFIGSLRRWGRVGGVGTGFGVGVGVQIGLLASFFAFGSGEVRAAEPIVYTVKVTAPETHYLDVRAVYPTRGREVIDLMMPIWSPGFYRVENYASRVEDLFARAVETDQALKLERPRLNRWRIQVQGANHVEVTYRLLCEGRSVTTNTVNDGLLVLNPAAAFITTVADLNRPHEVRLELPEGWKPAMSGLAPAKAGAKNHFTAIDFDTLVDRPILAGDLSVHEFTVNGVKHQLVDAGTHAQWDAEAGARDLEKIVRGTRDYWGTFPFARYVFLNVFRQGGGGLEHGNSTLLTSSPDMKTPTLRWLSFVGHEYFHAYNVKRLRPVELGPFDYEKPPSTSSLWISEGLTTYGADLVVARAGLATTNEFLGLLSNNIATLQTSPGRLKQTLEQASLDVWNSGTSGVGRDPQNLVSYYVKGPVVGFVLDAKVQRLTDGKKNLQDVMRLAYRRYSGVRGFTADEFQRTAEDVAKADLGGPFHSWLSSTDEINYQEALDWFGLRFTNEAGSTKPWQLAVREDASSEQNERLRKWLHHTQGR
jgi:predicted metalloprotease with PDZ domain